MIVHGVGASSGVGIGTAVYMQPPKLEYAHVENADPQIQRRRLDVATQAFLEQTQALASRVRMRAGSQEAQIIEAQAAIWQDPALQAEIDEKLAAGTCAEAAVDTVCRSYEELFAATQDEMLCQRVADVRDVRMRMLALLLGRSAPRRITFPHNAVLIANDLVPSMTVGLPREHLAAFLTQEGGYTSHAAILARTLGIPAVLGAAGVCDAAQDGACVVVDGAEGVAVLNPQEAELAHYRAKQSAEWERRAALEPFRSAPTRDADGNEYALYANIGGEADAKEAMQRGAEGVGLLRTEFLFMQHDRLPTEDEQYEAYCAIAGQVQRGSLIVRTLDAGADKVIPYLNMAKEENPALGQRGIRWCLSHPDVFCAQLRALLRAAYRYPELKIMLPLVTGVEEVRAARSLLAQCARQLQAEGVPHADHVQLGVMIETPAAVLTADLLALESDFFSIGTNDLTQYTLAVDRGNARVQAMHTPFHPAVLRAVRHTINLARQAGIPVGMCGEAAADLRMIPVLLAFGLQTFSVGAASVPEVRRQIAAWSLADAQEVAKHVLTLPDAKSVEKFLSEGMRKKA